MRTAFLETLLEVGEDDPNIWLLVGDLGYSVVEPFQKRFPSRFLNVGVAEQNMTGIAAGLALSGKTVFTYSIANFPTLRCLEQIRNDVCYHDANVKIVSVGGGLSYGSLGSTHHGTEDLAIMRALPNIRVVAPGDPIEAALATRAVAAAPGPYYLRLGKAGEPAVHVSKPAFELGGAITVRAGRDAAIFTTGGVLPLAAKAGALLAERGIGVRVLSMHTLKPLDTEAVLAAARETCGIVTIEEHGPFGALGEAVAAVLAAADTSVPFRQVSLPNAFSYAVGSQEHLRRKAGLSVKSLLATVMQVIQQAEVTDHPR